MKYATKNNGVTARPPTQLLGQVRNRLRAGQRRAGLSEPVLFVQMGQARVEAFLTRLATMRRCLRHAEPGVWLCCCFSTAKYCVSIGMTCPTKSRVVTILGSDVMVHNHAVTTSTARNEKTAPCAVFSSHLLPTHQGRRASASTSLALGSRSCLVTANGPMLNIGTATITEEITTITAPIMCVSARPSIDSPP